MRPTARATLALLLYLPVLGALGALILFCLYLLAGGKAAGLFALLYALPLYLLGRRAFSIKSGKVAALWKDIAFMALADLLLAVLGLSLLA